MNGSSNTPDGWVLKFLVQNWFSEGGNCWWAEIFCRWLMAVGVCFCCGKDCEVKKDAFVTGFVCPTLLGILMWVFLVKFGILFFPPWFFLWCFLSTMAWLMATKSKKSPPDIKSLEIDTYIIVFSCRLDDSSLGNPVQVVFALPPTRPNRWGGLAQHQKSKATPPYRSQVPENERLKLLKIKLSLKRKDHLPTKPPVFVVAW